MRENKLDQKFGDYEKRKNNKKKMCRRRWRRRNENVYCIQILRCHTEKFIITVQRIGLNSRGRIRVRVKARVRIRGEDNLCSRSLPGPVRRAVQGFGLL